jgi:methionyl-tRNA formyltransferase
MAKIVFMGTPDFAVPTLKALIRFHDVIGVVTQPDRPSGRKGKITPPPVKVAAEEAGIPVFQPEKIRKPEAIEQLKQWEADVYVVAAFGQILPQEVLDIPPFGSINIHASLLPRWRGAAPIQAAIRAGDVTTGVTIMKMDAGLDTGPMLSLAQIIVERDETGQTLHDKLAELGPDLLINTLPVYLSGGIEPRPQSENGVTIAPRIEKEEGRINWGERALRIDRLVRAFTPWPGTFTTWNGKQLKIHSGTAEPGKSEPGVVIEVNGQVAIGTKGGLYYPTKVQLAGKKAVDIADFVRGHGDFVGSVLGEVE